MEQKLPHPALANIRLTEVAEGHWRVTDGRFRATNPRTLLGFIRESDAGFEATDERGSDEPVLYGSREAAMAAFVPVTAVHATAAHTPALVDTTLVDTH